MTSFHAYIAIDWSGAQELHTSSIALAEALADKKKVTLIAPPEKQWSRSSVATWILRQADCSKRLLIGIDSNLGYAAGFLKTRLPKLKKAQELWQIIDEHCQGEENFYASTFWKESLFCHDFWTQGKQPSSFSSLRRQTELACRAECLGTPESPLKLLGAKQVGKGGLAAMRMAHFLKKELQEKIAFWPFDTSASCSRATIVVTEIYPRLFLQRANSGSSKIRSMEKLKELLFFYQSTSCKMNNLSDHQADALATAAGMRYFLKKNPSLFNIEECPLLLQQQLQVEGWILGAPFPKKEKP